MKTKLTLSLDKAIIEKGRSIAKREHRSLSSLVEDLLKLEVEKDSFEKHQLVKNLHGMFKSSDLKKDSIWKEEIREAADKKYGE